MPGSPPLRTLRALLPLLLLALPACQSTTLLHLQSTPEGAWVSEIVEGELGRTDMMVELRSDRGSNREFLFQKAGYHDEQVSQSVSGREMTIHVALQRKPTTVRVRTNPSSAEVRLFLGEQLIDWSGLRPGTGTSLEDEELWGPDESAGFTFEISADGYQTRREDRLLERGRDYDLEFSLLEQRATITFESQPQGVDVYERSLGFLGRTPMTVVLDADQFERISARRDQREHSVGRLWLRAVKRGYRDSELNQEIRIGGADNRVVIDLESSP